MLNSITSVLPLREVSLKQREGSLKDDAEGEKVDESKNLRAKAAKS